MGKCPFEGLVSGPSPHGPNVVNKSKNEKENTKFHMDGDCPFGKVVEDKKNDLKDCPAFKESCPLKEAQSIQQVSEFLENVPPSHRKGGGENGKAVQVFGEVLKDIHNVQYEQFEKECPFKNVSPNEKKDIPLVTKEEILSWPGLNVDFDNEEEDEYSSLDKLLKERTKKIHKEAENVHFVRYFIKAKIQTNEYRQLLVRLYNVYNALEQLLDSCNDERVKKIHFPNELGRIKFIEEDLEYFYGSDWKNHVNPSNATKEYVERLEYVAKNNPPLLIAHSYTRYLGDLSGGRTLYRIAKKALDLPKSGEGGKFYVFENISSPKEFKTMYRANLKELNITDKLAEEIAQEAVHAFRLNIGLFQEMDILCGLVTPPSQSKDIMVKYLFPLLICIMALIFAMLQYIFHSFH